MSATAPDSLITSPLPSEPRTRITWQTQDGLLSRNLPLFGTVPSALQAELGDSAVDLVALGGLVDPPGASQLPGDCALDVRVRLGLDRVDKSGPLRRR
jgi:hypothetical protein